MQITIYVNAKRKAKLAGRFPEVPLREAIALWLDELPEPNANDTITITTSKKEEEDSFAAEIKERLSKIQQGESSPLATQELPQRQGDASAYPPPLPSQQQEEDDWEIVEDKGEDW